MPLIYENSYKNIKDCVQPGDVIAFSGGNHISTVIKLVTSSHVSHVGVIVPDDSPRDDDSDELPLIAEATEDGMRTRALRGRYDDDDVEKLWWLPLDSDLSLEGFRSYLRTYGERRYDYLQAAMLGLMLLQPTLDAIDPDLDDRIRQFIEDTLNRGSASENQERRSQTRRFLIRTVAERLNASTGNHIPLSLIRTVLGDNTSTNPNEGDLEDFFCSEFVTGALSAGGVIEGINPTQVTPIDLCRFHLYQENYTQFKGDEATRIRGFNCVDPSRWEG